MTGHFCYKCLRRHAWDRSEPDIVLTGVEAPIVGRIPGLRGREAVNEVIDQLLGDCGEED